MEGFEDSPKFVKLIQRGCAVVLNERQVLNLLKARDRLDVHLPHGFDVGKGGAEYALMQLLIAIALLITGAGAYSLTPRLPKPLRKL